MIGLIWFLMAIFLGCDGVVLGGDRDSLGVVMWRVLGCRRIVLVCDGRVLGFNGIVLYVTGFILGGDKDSLGL